MTNDELSAKVAEARGDSMYVDGEVTSWFHHPDGTVELFPRPYATDMNAACDFEAEITAAGYRIETHAWPDGTRAVSICTVDEIGEHVVAAGEADTMPKAYSRAYLAFKGVE